MVKEGRERRNTPAFSINPAVQEFTDSHAPSHLHRICTVLMILMDCFRCATTILVIRSIGETLGTGECCEGNMYVHQCCCISCLLISRGSYITRHQYRMVHNFISHDKHLRRASCRQGNPICSPRNGRAYGNHGASSPEDENCAV